jgi:CcmD family protein
MKLEGYRLASHRSLEATTLAAQTSDKESKGSPADGRSDKFVAVEGGAEQMSGGTLLVEAYAATWIILFGFVIVSWRRQARIDARVAELERTVARGHAK